MTEKDSFHPKVCGNCKKPVQYVVTKNGAGFAIRGLWYHDHSGHWQCDNGTGDANTWQVSA